MTATNESVNDAAVLEKTKDDFDSILDSVSRETIDLATGLTTRSSSQLSVDRLRAMYARDGSLPRPIQIV